MKTLIFLSLVALVAGKALDDCATCKLVVTEIDAELKSNATMAEIEATVNKICDAIPGIGDQCKQYVKQYVPEIVDMIAAKITPKEVCDKLHLCNSSFIDYMREGVMSDLPLGPGPVIVAPQEDVPLLQTEPHIEAQQPQDGQFCAICEFALKEIEDQIGNNATEAEIVAAVEKICDILPSTVKTECKQVVETQGPAIIEALIARADPKTVCTLIRLCTSNGTMLMKPQVGPVIEEETEAVQQPEAGPLCALCELAMSKIEGMITNNSTEAEIIAAVEKVCDIMPSSLKDECKQLIEQSGTEIINLLINKASPAVVCTALRLCAAAAAPVKVQDGPYCPICEQVLNYVDGLLKQNATLTEIEAFMENVCSYLPSSLKSQCKELVDTYAPQIVQALANKIVPKQVCTEIGLCSAVAAEKTMAVRAV